ncbi:5306_t:CDS:1, partial [Gigaspora margarita]
FDNKLLVKKINYVKVVSGVSKINGGPGYLDKYRQLWDNYGTTTEQLWDNYGTTMGQLRDNYGNFLI